MKKEYKVTRYFVETTEEEKEEIYKQIANIFIRMAQKELENKIRKQLTKWKEERYEWFYKMDRRTSLENNVLHRDTYMYHIKCCNHIVNNVVNAEIIIGTKILLNKNVLNSSKLKDL